MNVTALFVELLVIGMGTATWLALFLAAILGYRFDTHLLQENPALIGTLTAIVYVLGIVVDRLVRDLFMPTLEAKARSAVFTADRIAHVKAIAPDIDEGNLSMEMEKFIRANSESLAHKIDYNRSRLRICRAWILHFALIGVGFTWWNSRVQLVDAATQVWLLSGDVLLMVLTWRVAYLLAMDHHKDLIESFQIVAAARAR